VIRKGFEIVNEMFRLSKSPPEGWSTMESLYPEAGAVEIGLLIPVIVMFIWPEIDPDKSAFEITIS